MINRIINIALDTLTVALLFFLAPILIALFSPVMPVYAKVIGAFFVTLICGSVFFRLKLNARRNAARRI